MRMRLDYTYQSDSTGFYFNLNPIGINIISPDPIWSSPKEIYEESIPITEKSEQSDDKQSVLNKW